MLINIYYFSDLLKNFFHIEVPVVRENKGNHVCIYVYIFQIIFYTFNMFIYRFEKIQFEL